MPMPQGGVTQRVIGTSGGYQTCQSKRFQRTSPEVRWDRFNLRRSHLNKKRPQRSQQNWSRHSNAPSQGGDDDRRQYQRAKLLPVPSRRFTLAGHYPKRNGPSSGASEAVLGRSAQSAERHPTISKGRTQPSFQSQWPVLLWRVVQKKRPQPRGRGHWGPLSLPGQLGSAAPPITPFSCHLFPILSVACFASASGLFRPVPTFSEPRLDHPRLFVG